MKTLTERQVDFLIKFASLILFAETRNIPFIITAYYRTPDEQNALFRRGLSKYDGYIKRSNHQDRLAFDIVILNAEWKPINEYGDAPEYHALGEEWERIGGRWGGLFSFNDVFHFEALSTD